MSPALRLALSGSQDQPKTWGPRHARRGMTVNVIKCRAPEDQCIHAALVRHVGVVVRTESDHALVQFVGNYAAWLPQFHLKEVKAHG